MFLSMPNFANGTQSNSDKRPTMDPTIGLNTFPRIHRAIYLVNGTQANTIKYKDCVLVKGLCNIGHRAIIQTLNLSPHTLFLVCLYSSHAFALHPCFFGLGNCTKCHYVWSVLLQFLENKTLCIY